MTGAVYAAQNKMQKVVNHVFDTALRMEKPKKTTTGKDVVSLELGKEFGKNKDKVKVGLTVKVAANSDKGMTLGGGASIEVNKVGNADVSVTAYNDSKGKTKFETEADVNLFPNAPNDEVSLNLGAATINANPKEASNLFFDAIDGMKKYVKAEVEKVKDVINGNVKKQ